MWMLEDWPSGREDGGMTTGAPDLTRLAGTLGDATRIRMLGLLMDGRALTAKELAYGSGVGPATATGHLQRLAADKLVVSTVQGRYKYFRIATPEVAACMEAMLVLAPRAGAQGNRDASATPDPVREARFCYDHLAGKLGVAITARLLSGGRLNPAPGAEPRYDLTAQGEKWFAGVGVDVRRVREQRRRFACPCLDWSERRDHLAGALGAALADALLVRGWTVREREGRVARVTAAGVRGLKSSLRLSWPLSAG
jgi:DNA-binding transcriptional ArsR family regulator